MSRKNNKKMRVFGTGVRPRLSVFRSQKHFYVQIINDEEGKTLFSFSDKHLATKGKKLANNVKNAGILGQEIGKGCLEKGIKQVVFDRGPYLYHGRVAALAQGARAAGLIF